MVTFPSDEWAKAFMKVLNDSEVYAEAAKDWEGDFYYVVNPEGALKEKAIMEPGNLRFLILKSEKKTLLYIRKL